ncbi:MAG: carboxypeptidase-like regulatory domain-containing protein [Bryobacteraceae bacterium]
MGATVFLFNRYDRMARLLTNDRGAFQFDQLAPDNYSVRVRLASFVPALKRNIAIQPGMRSFLAINLNSMLSSIELVYTSPAKPRS